MDCSPPGSSEYGILQARILECVVMLSYRGPPWPRDRTLVSWIAGRFFTAESPEKPSVNLAVVQSLSCVRLFVTPWIAACQSSPSITISWILLKLISIESVMPSNHPIHYCPILLSGCFLISQLFTSGGQSIGVSASASVFPKNILDWIFPLGLTGWSHWSTRDSKEFFPTPQFKSISSSELSFLYGPALTSNKGPNLPTKVCLVKTVIFR